MMPNLKSYRISSTGRSYNKREKMKVISVALLTGMVGCAFAQPLSAAEKVVYSFAGGTDVRRTGADLRKERRRDQGVGR